jgi:hypothetical protein
MGPFNWVIAFVVLALTGLLIFASQEIHYGNELAIAFFGSLLVALTKLFQIWSGTKANGRGDKG